MKKRLTFGKNKAFTLAETLITLVIIGVVAAISVPTVMNIYGDKMYVSSLKKNYANFSKAFNLAQKYEYNDYEDWAHADGDVDELFQNYKYIKKYLYVMRECKNEAGCWSYDKTKGPNGFIANGATDIGIGNALVTFTLQDGTNVCLDYYNQSDTDSLFGVNQNLLPSSLIIWVDVNGDRKPNRMGKDVFSFVLTRNGLVPSGANNNSAHCEYSGYDCSAKFIYTY